MNPVNPHDFPPTESGFFSYWLERCDTDDWYGFSLMILRNRMTQQEWINALADGIGRGKNESMPAFLERAADMIESNPMAVYFSLADKDWEPTEAEERLFLDQCVKKFAEEHNLPLKYFINVGPDAPQSVWIDWSISNAQSNTD